MKAKYVEMLQNNIGATMKGQIAGFGGWLNGKITKAEEDGSIEMEFTVREEMLNPMGNIHGGAIAAIIDEILGFQLFLQSAEDAAYVSMTMNVDFLRAAQVDHIITAVPQVIRIGKRTANVVCELLNAEGKIIAKASSNFMRVM